MDRSARHFLNQTKGTCSERHFDAMHRLMRISAFAISDEKMMQEIV
jgi:hypothetical protein